MSGASQYNTPYTQQDIARYLRGELSPGEMHAMEKAALNDPFLADAIEGFREADPSVAAAHLAAIRETIQQQQEVPETVRPVRHRQNWWRIAAAILLVAGASTIGWLVLRNDTAEPVLAERKALITPPPPAQRSDSTPMPVNDAMVAVPGNITTPAKKSTPKYEERVVDKQESFAPAAAAPPANNLAAAESASLDEVVITRPRIAQATADSSIAAKQREMVTAAATQASQAEMAAKEAVSRTMLARSMTSGAGVKKDSQAVLSFAASPTSERKSLTRSGNAMGLVGAAPNIEKIAQPAGGWDSLTNTLRRRIQELPEYRSGAPKGKVSAMLFFNKEGKLTDAIITKGFDTALNKLVRDFLLQWPAWRADVLTKEVQFEL